VRIPRSSILRSSVSEKTRSRTFGITTLLRRSGRSPILLRSTRSWQWILSFREFHLPWMSHTGTYSTRQFVSMSISVRSSNSGLLWLTKEESTQAGSPPGSSTSNLTLTKTFTQKTPSSCWRIPELTFSSLRRRASSLNDLRSTSSSPVFLWTKMWHG
jgi:hypothetical protein